MQDLKSSGFYSMLKNNWI